MSRRFLEGLIVHRVVGIARHESRVDHLSIVSIGEKGPPRVYLPRNPGSFAVNRLIDTSRVPGPTQGGSLRAIDHWLVARTNNGSRYRSIFLEDDLMDTLLATSRAHRWLPCIYRYTWPQISRVRIYIYIHVKFASESTPRHPPLNANADFLRNCSCAQLTARRLMRFLAFVSDMIAPCREVLLREKLLLLEINEFDSCYLNIARFYFFFIINVCRERER